MTTKIKSIVSSQLPDFVREDYPAFVEFLEAYYEFLDQSNQRNLEDITDIDNTLDSFISEFKKELHVFGESAYDNINNRLLLRKVKEIYAAKGSEPAYKFLFRILFNKTADISYPWEQVLKPSDGKWRQETSIFLNVLTGTASELPGNKITIINGNTKVRAYVERVTFVRGNIYEVFIDRNYYGTIDVGNQVLLENNGFSAVIIPTTVGYVIESPGTGYKAGDLITANTTAGSVIVETLLKVTEVDSNGGLVKLSTIKFGCGYSDEFFVQATTSAFTNASRLNLSKNSVQLFDIPDESYIEKYAEAGFAINPDYVIIPPTLSDRYTDPAYVGTTLREFYSTTINGESVDYSLIRFKIGAVAKYQGYYTSNDGFLDDIIKIQDSYYYQKYSYLITIDERLEDYKTVLKSYIHAAGMKLFSEFKIENVYAPGVEGEIFVDNYVSRATFRTINKNIINEYVVPSDSGGRIRINAYDAETYFEATYNPDTYQDFTG